jgi:hypothetical protein
LFSSSLDGFSSPPEETSDSPEPSAGISTVGTSNPSSVLEDDDGEELPVQPTEEMNGNGIPTKAAARQNRYTVFDFECVIGYLVAAFAVVFVAVGGCVGGFTSLETFALLLVYLL